MMPDQPQSGGRRIGIQLLVVVGDGGKTESVRREARPKIRRDEDDFRCRSLGPKRIARGPWPWRPPSSCQEVTHVHDLPSMRRVQGKTRGFLPGVRP